MKDGTRRYFCLTFQTGAANYYAVVFDLQTAILGSEYTSGTPTNTGYAIETLENGWYRCLIKMTVASGDSLLPHFALSDVASPGTRVVGIPSYTGDSSSYLYVWGMQCEQGAFASSYIPTTTTSATRAADVVTCIGNLVTSLTGSAVSIVFDGKLVPQPSGTTPVMISDSFTDLVLYTVAGNNIVRTYDGATELGATIGASLTLYDGAKLGLSGDSGNRSVVGGGGTVATEANDIPALSGTIENHVPRI